MVLYSNNVSPKILITCPHCKFGSRYDASFLEDAIHDHKGIECAACFLSFNVVVMRTESHGPTLRAPDQPEQSGLDEMEKLLHCLADDGILQEAIRENAARSDRSVGG